MESSVNNFSDTCKKYNHLLKWVAYKNKLLRKLLKWYFTDLNLRIEHTLITLALSIFYFDSDIFAHRLRCHKTGTPKHGGR